MLLLQILNYPEKGQGFIAFQIGKPVVSYAKVIAEGFSYHRSGFYDDSHSHFQLKYPFATFIMSALYF